MAGTGELKTFAVPPGIPIIGQPFLVKAGFVTVMGNCRCRGEETGVLLAGGPGQCPSCGRMFILLTAQFDARTGQLTTTVGLAAARASVDTEGPTPEPEGPTS